MRIKKTLLMLAILAVVLPSIRAADDHKLVQTWVDPAYEGRRLHKVIVVCIAGLTLERKQFEDKFLTHLDVRLRKGYQ